MESIATIKARLLVKNLNPAYPLNIKWFVTEVLDKEVKMHYKELDPRCSAVVINKPYYDYIHICVNKHHTSTRQRFATLHEVGHIYCEHDGNINFMEGEEDPVLRKEADDFATELLMPKYRILNIASGIRQPIKLIKSVCRYHKSSYEAASRRILELEICHGSIFMFDYNRLFYSYQSPGFVTSDSVKQVLRRECPNMIKGVTIQREIITQDEALMLYIHRFYTGTFIGICKRQTPIQNCSKLLDGWMGGIAR